MDHFTIEQVEKPESAIVLKLNTLVKRSKF